MTEYKYRISRLTNKFYLDHPDPPYREILKKHNRPYNCLLIQAHSDSFICIPYRTEIHHDYAYKFSSSIRSKKHNSGLDYTKIIIVSNTDYICSDTVLIDKEEYIETVRNIDRILSEASRYVMDYSDHVKGTKLLHPAEFRRRYTYSTLPYFHRELHINI